MMDKKYKEFSSKIDSTKTKLEQPLAGCTTVGIGGTADLQYFPENSGDLSAVCEMAFDQDIPITVIGGGSNILISDDGLRGLVVVNVNGNYSIGGESKRKGKTKSLARWSIADSATKRYDFEDLDYDESDCRRVTVEVDSGTRLQQFLYEMLDHHVTGLQWFSGIPGTIGGDVFNNLHGGTHFFSEVVDYVEALTQEGEVRRYSVEEIKPDYNYTIFHKNKEIILKAGLSLFFGDSNKARYVADEWRKRKQEVQPQKTPGCIFANISNEQKEAYGYPTTCVGYIIEHVLKMSKYRVGNAMISEKHHNFIVTEGKCSALDYLQVIRDITKAAKDDLDIDLVTEIIPLGFTDDELEGVNFPTR
ncbi:FAD-binding protein [Candidatus Dojkabacteria bacterium]|nr:FAD-binding protein [Candidatus Dojkabacteria bacterium]